jgi:hypothetical protein
MPSHIGSMTSAGVGHGPSMDPASAHMTSQGRLGRFWRVLAVIYINHAHWVAALERTAGGAIAPGLGGQIVLTPDRHEASEHRSVWAQVRLWGARHSCGSRGKASWLPHVTIGKKFTMSSGPIFLENGISVIA